MLKGLRFLNQPYNLFLLTSIILIAFSVVFIGQQFDLTFHDAYYVFPLPYLYITLGAIFFLGWTIYKLSKSILLNKTLTWVHVISTLVVVIVLIVLALDYDNLFPPIKRSAVNWYTEQSDLKKLEIVILPASILFLFGQFFFIINLVFGTIKYLYNIRKNA